MKIFPAIDIIDGGVVRLLKGDYNAVKKYNISPIEAALSFNERGATCLHAVDLNGAESGRAENAQTVEAMISATNLFVEIGGGIRTQAQVESYLAAGAGRVILGTAAVKNFPFVQEMCKKFPGKIAVGVDAVGGLVAVNGWKEITDVNAFSFCKRLADAGVSNVVYTDISRDGTLSGTNLEAYEKLVQIEGLLVTASGGVTFLKEIEALKSMGVYAVVLGKALYENKIDLTEAIRIAEGGDAC